MTEPMTIDVLPDVLELVVTREHALRGHVGDCKLCPIAQSLREKFPSSQIVVNPYHEPMTLKLGIAQGAIQETALYLMPEEVYEYAFRYDRLPRRKHSRCPILPPDWPDSVTFVLKRIPQEGEAIK